MKILVTNDDGIYSPGLMALAQAASAFGDVLVMAPDVEQSSMGQAITSSRPLSYKKSPINFENIQAYRVNGTPSDCVALGTHLWTDVDVVLSGINMGPNLGNAMWHSGTLAAAKQAVLLGKRGIALSTPVDKKEPDFDSLKPYVREVLDLLLQTTDRELYNVNFPQKPLGTMWTRQAVTQYDGKVVPAMDPMGRKHYWYTVFPLEQPEEGTDLWAMGEGLISITPLRLDLTDHQVLRQRMQDSKV